MSMTYRARRTEERILRFPQTQKTRARSRSACETRGGKNWKSVIVVTSNYHTRRQYIFRRIFRPYFVVWRARETEISIRSIGLRKEISQRFVKEVAGMVVAIWNCAAKGYPQISQSVVGPGHEPQ